jgi:ABC-type sugar transport system ATPase subunit
MRPPLVQFSGVGKSFGPTRVLDDVSFDLHPGEVHVLAGENGAGKSTLIKILAGVYPDYDGVIRLRGAQVHFTSPQAARRHGIAVIHQELSLVDSLSVVDNIQLGRERTQAGGWWLDRRAARAQAAEHCSHVALEFSEADFARPVGEFHLSIRHRIEIAKALAGDAQVLVMDEPTSALDQPEVDRLMQLIDTVAWRGCCVVYITHKMEEIYRMADRITVLRDGRRIGTAEAEDCPEPRLIQWMIGRELTEQFPAPPPRPVAPPLRLAIRNFRVPHEDPARPDHIGDFSLEVGAGEIVGLAGLQGSGNTELLQALFGAREASRMGTVELDGVPFLPQSPGDSIRRGVAYLTGDRKGTGLVPGLSIGDNINLAALPRISPAGVLRPDLERENAAYYIESLHIRPARPEQPVGTLSGGNQQKVVLAKWLSTQPKVILLEEPTRGVDVGAKREIYHLLRECAAAGVALLLISSELPELLGLSDRIIVLHRGEVTGKFTRAEATQAKILAAAMGAA